MTKILLLLLFFCKKVCIFYIRRIPNQDAYASVYSIVADIATHLDEVLKDLPTELEEVQKELKANPDQMDNSRTIDWIYYPKE
jgi:ssDNA-specific exonuclease RecJ